MGRKNTYRSHWFSGWDWMFAKSIKEPWEAYRYNCNNIHCNICDFIKNKFVTCNINNNKNSVLFPLIQSDI